MRRIPASLALLLLSLARPVFAQEPAPTPTPAPDPNPNPNPNPTIDPTPAPAPVADKPVEAPPPAHKMFESTRGPFYLQAAPLGYNHWASAPGVCGGKGCGGWPGFRPDLEFGMHFGGRYDRLVLAVRQSFVFTGGPGNVGGTTLLKIGWDIAIPIKSFEIVASPYTSAGIGYSFADGGTIGFNAGFFGLEGKFFFLRGLYGFVRPFEFGMQCFHSPTTNCWLQATAGAGVGYAFPTH